MNKHGLGRITHCFSSPFSLACSVALLIGNTTNTTACSAQEPGPPPITAEDVETVEARLAYLSSLGITVPQEAETPPPQTYMTGAMLAVESREGFSEVYGQWKLILADGLEHVEFHFSRMAGEEGYSLFNIRKTDGQWLFVPGEDAPETFAVEFGKVIKFADPLRAKLDLDIQILEALAAEEQAEVDPEFAQRLSPGAIDHKTEGVSAYLIEGYLIMIANEGPSITNVFWATTTSPFATTGSDDETSPPEPDDDGQSIVALSPAQQAAIVCNILFQTCQTHQDDLGVRACIAWLEHCAPSAPAN